MVWHFLANAKIYGVVELEEGTTLLLRVTVGRLEREGTFEGV